jgi:hypothetical protein
LPGSDVGVNHVTGAGAAALAKYVVAHRRRKRMAAHTQSALPTPTKFLGRSADFCAQNAHARPAIPMLLPPMECKRAVPRSLLCRARYFFRAAVL